MSMVNGIGVSAGVRTTPIGNQSGQIPAPTSRVEIAAPLSTAPASTGLPLFAMPNYGAIAQANQADLEAFLNNSTNFNPGVYAAVVNAGRQGSNQQVAQSTASQETARRREFDADQRKIEKQEEANEKARAAAMTEGAISTGMSVAQGAMAAKSVKDLSAAHKSSTRAVKLGEQAGTTEFKATKAMDQGRAENNPLQQERAVELRQEAGSMREGANFHNNRSSALQGKAEALRMYGEAGRAFGSGLGTGVRGQLDYEAGQLRAEASRDEAVAQVHKADKNANEGQKSSGQDLGRNALSMQEAANAANREMGRSPV